MIEFAWVCFGCAAVPAALYLWNSFLFREPPPLGEPRGSSPWSAETPTGVNPVAREAISVLIPARNEELGIAACLESVLASQHVALEVIVLDDSSTDRTAEIVREIAAKDSRLRLETAPPLPDGWCGKQAACFALSKHARHDVFTFLDADVRLEPEALARMARFLKQSQCELVSGFPRQETVTFLEKLLIPLINWLLLCWLPIWGMRHFRWSAFGAGCGQWFMTTRAAYENVGGHATVKASLHDGLTLPRAYRRAGFFTDICDATNLATCRMYRSGFAVWNGLAKNAREGMASAGQIGFWTVVLLCGQVLPFALLVDFTGRCMGHELPGMEGPSPEIVNQIDIDHVCLQIMTTTCSLAVIPRLSAAGRFHQPWLGVILHPFSVLLLLAIQWYAIIRALLGKPIGWKGRTHPGLSLGNAPRST